MPGDSQNMDQIFQLLQQQQVEFTALKTETLGRINQLSAQVKDLQQNLDDRNPKDIAFRVNRRVALPRSASVRCN